MISKAEISLVKSLAHKKHRQETSLFVAEGIKIVEELLEARFEWYKFYSTDPKDVGRGAVLVSDAELKKLSFLKQPNGRLGIFRIPTAPPLPARGLLMALDTLQDPGNLGTIIRLCDWFGVRHLICGHGSADYCNPKVIQATMGSVARVHVHYLDLKQFLEQNKLPAFAMTMRGTPLGEAAIPEEAVILMGNESRGVSPELLPYCKEVTIPARCAEKKPESLNVASAAAIVLYEASSPG